MGNELNVGKPNRSDKQGNMEMNNLEEIQNRLGVQGRFDRLRQLVEFTNERDDFISHIDAFYLSVALGFSDWVDEWVEEKYSPHAYTNCRLWFNDTINSTLTFHFQDILKEGDPRRRVITKTRSMVGKYKKDNGWRKWRDGYHGVRINPDGEIIMERTKMLVDHFHNRWADNPEFAKPERSFVWNKFNYENSLDWILNDEYVERIKQEMKSSLDS